MAVIGTLAVNIVAKTDKFTKGLNKSRGALSRFTKATGSATKFVTGFIGAFTAGVGIVGVTAMLKGAAERLDDLAKASDKLGIASENLAGLQHAANQTGVSTSTLNMALQRMVRRVAEAANGTGEAVKALDELNLNANELNQLAPDEIFARVAEQMKGVGTQSDRVRLAMKLFDSEGVALVNTLGLGADGLQKMQDEAERLGLAIERQDLKKVERFSDALDRLGKAFKGAANKIVIDVAPAVSETVEGILLIMEELQGRKGGKKSTGGMARSYLTYSPAYEAGKVIADRYVAPLGPTSTAPLPQAQTQWEARQGQRSSPYGEPLEEARKGNTLNEKQLMQLGEINQSLQRWNESRNMSFTIYNAQ